jgi:heme-degrading monooxygenase HmoA
VKKVEQAFAQLPSQIKEIAGFEWGLDNSPENINQGFTHCFFVSFKSEDDRAAYLPHPAHKAFVDVLKPHLDKVLVIDYWANK